MIAVRNLTYAYPGARTPAVSDVSFAVSPGEIFGLLGPSGAGKSTIQRVLTRLNRRYRGSASVLSRALDAWDHRLYEHIGVGFELPNHYPRLTGRENLAFFASLYRQPVRDAEELLEAVGLADAADERVGEYSKGMRTRLNFARALLHGPSVLFLDEPTAGLDPVNAALIRELIRRERSGGATILLTTHNMTDVDELCDRVGFLVAGAMAVVDEPATLKSKYGRRSVRVEYAAPGGRVGVKEFPLDGLGHDRAFLDLLDTRAVRALHSQEADLNEVFAIATGVHLRSGRPWRSPPCTGG